MVEKIITDEQIGEVTLCRSVRVRRMTIRVHPVRGVNVSIPWRARESDGLRFFQSKRDWILRTIERQRRWIASAEETGRAVASLGDGTVIRTLLSEMVFREGEQPGIETQTLEDVRETGRLYLSPDRPVRRKVVHFTPETDLRGTLVELLCAEAKALLPGKLRFLAERYGFEYGRVAIKHNSSNWGSCSTKGNINLNLNLVRLPEPLCDYVLLHELCHLHHLNHGDRFHRELATCVADNLARLTAQGDPFAVQLSAGFEFFLAGGGSLGLDAYLSRQIARYRLI